MLDAVVLIMVYGDDVSEKMEIVERRKFDLNDFDTFCNLPFLKGLYVYIVYYANWYIAG